MISIRFYNIRANLTKKNDTPKKNLPKLYIADRISAGVQAHSLLTPDAYSLFLPQIMVVSTRIVPIFVQNLQ